ncbi:hypothetical protein ACFQ0B_25905 [Nonomuraea thailandensis]
MHHLNFHVDDLGAAVARLTGRGFRLHGLNRSDVRWQEVFLHPKEAHGVLIQLAQPGSRDPGSRVRAWRRCWPGEAGTATASPALEPRQNLDLECDSRTRIGEADEAGT